MTKEEIKHSSKNGKMSQTQIIKININTEKKAKRKQTPKPKAKESKEPALTPEEKAYLNAYGDTGQDNQLIKPPLRHSTGFNDTQSFNPIVIPTITDAQMTQLNTQPKPSTQLTLPAPPAPANPNIYLRNEPMDLQPLWDFMSKQLTYTNMPSGKYSDRFTEEFDEEFETTPPTSPVAAPAAAAPASPTAFPNPLSAIAGMLSPTAAGAAGSAAAPAPTAATAAGAKKRGKPMQPRENISRRSLYLRIKRLLNSEVLSENKLNIAKEDYQYFVKEWKPDSYYIDELKGLFPERIRNTL